jgi:hypothetical protein
MGNGSRIRNQRWRPSITWIRASLALLVASVLIVAGVASKRDERKSSEAISTAPALSFDSARGNALTFGDDSKIIERHLFPYSIIPGGVQSPQELKNAILRDPVVSAHYADFDTEKAHVTFLDRDRAVYVSYRMGGEVFWTSRPLRLHAGETVITDGTHVARTRCGNRISETPQSPISGQQPELEAFERRPAIVGQMVPLNLPMNGSLTQPSLFLLPAPAETEHNEFPSPFLPFVPGPGPTSGTIFAAGSGSTQGTGSAFGVGSLAPPIGTPEPSTLLLLATGLSALGIAYKRRKAD